MKRPLKVLLLITLTLGLGLRLQGIRWGLYNGKYFHDFSFHPDEQCLVLGVQGMNPGKLDFKPRNMVVWSKGTLMAYLTGIASAAASVFRFIDPGKVFSYARPTIEEVTKLYLTGRLVSVFFGVLSIYLLFLTGRKIYGEKAALLAAFFLAIIPAHVVNSHYLATDVTATFWILLVFFISLHILDSDKAKYYILAGAVAGVAVTAKYNSGAAVVIPLAAHSLKLLRKRDFNPLSPANSKAFIIPAALAAGVVISNPYILTSFSDLKAGLAFTLECVNQSLNPGSDAAPGQSVWLFYVTNAFLYGAGLPFSMLFAAGVAWSLKKRKNTDIMILVWLAAWWLVLSSQNWKLIRWVLPVIPFLCLGASGFIAEIYVSLNRSARCLLASLVVFSAGYTLLYSEAYSKLMSQTSSQEEVSAWIEENIKEGSSIATPGMPALWDPLILQLQYFVRSDDPLLGKMKRYRVAGLGVSTGKIKSERPDYIVMNDYFYFPVFFPEVRGLYADRMEFIDYVMKGDEYKLLKTFGKKPGIFGFYPKKGFFPHDWRYVCPEILIYKHV